jgi:hypothetical protein
MTTEQTLQFGKKPIRIVIIDGNVWFTAADLYATQRTHTNKKALSCFGREHLRLHTFETTSGPKRFTLVSPRGALSVAADFQRPGDRIVDAWVRKTMVELGFDRPPLTLGADGTMPVRPRASDYDGSAAWDALKRRSLDTSRNPPVEGVPELDDDDESRPPTDDEISAAFAAVCMSDDDEQSEVVPSKPRKRRTTTTRAKRK